MVATMAIIATLAAIATPSIKDALDSMRLDMALRDLEWELRAARLRAVSTNRPLMVNFLGKIQMDP